MQMPRSWLKSSLGAAAISLALTSCGGLDPVPAPKGGLGDAEATGCPTVPEQLRDAQSVVYEDHGRPIRLFVLMPSDNIAKHPAILFFFGGGWNSGSVTAFKDQARAFQRLGYVAVLADYRVRCRDHTTPLAATKDAENAYRWIRLHAREYQVDQERIVLAGGSAGGQLAAATALRAPRWDTPAALVLFNPAVDLVGPAPWYAKLMARAISPSALSAKTAPPTIIFHGKADTRVPIGTVRAFCGSLRRAGRDCRLIEYAGQEHGFYHSKQPLPSLGRSAYDDTLSRSIRFLGEIGVTNPKPIQGTGHV